MNKTIKADNIKYIEECATTKKERRIKRKKMKLINQIEKESSHTLSLRKKRIHEFTR